MNFVTLMAGYKNIPQVFVPDGSAVRETGPVAESYSTGASVDILDYGTIDIAYEWRILKYYDSYFSNTNYVSQKNGTFAIAYTYKF